MAFMQRLVHRHRYQQRHRQVIVLVHHQWTLIRRCRATLNIVALKVSATLKLLQLLRFKTFELYGQNLSHQFHGANVQSSVKVESFVQKYFLLEIPIL